MPPVQIREVPDELYAMLKAEAAEAGRSISKQMLFILQQHLEQREQSTPQGPIYITEADCYENPLRRTHYAYVDVSNRKRREELFARIDKLDFPEITGELADTAAMIRQMRAER